MSSPTAAPRRGSTALAPIPENKLAGVQGGLIAAMEALLDTAPVVAPRSPAGGSRNNATSSSSSSSDQNDDLDELPPQYLAFRTKIRDFVAWVCEPPASEPMTAREETERTSRSDASSGRADGDNYIQQSLQVLTSAMMDEKVVTALRVGASGLGPATTAALAERGVKGATRIQEWHRERGNLVAQLLCSLCGDSSDAALWAVENGIKWLSSNSAPAEATVIVQLEFGSKVSHLGLHVKALQLARDAMAALAPCPKEPESDPKVLMRLYFMVLALNNAATESEHLKDVGAAIRYFAQMKTKATSWLDAFATSHRSEADKVAAHVTRLRREAMDRLTALGGVDVSRKIAPGVGPTGRPVYRSTRSPRANRADHHGEARQGATAGLLTPIPPSKPSETSPTFGVSPTRTQAPGAGISPRTARIVAPPIDKRSLSPRARESVEVSPVLPSPPLFSAKNGPILPPLRFPSSSNNAPSNVGRRPSVGSDPVRRLSMGGEAGRRPSISGATATTATFPSPRTSPRGEAFPPLRRSPSAVKGMMQQNTMDFADMFSELNGRPALSHYLDRSKAALEAAPTYQKFSTSGALL